MRKALDIMEAEPPDPPAGRGTFVNDQGRDDLALRLDNLRMADGKHLDGKTKTMLTWPSTPRAMRSAFACNSAPEDRILTSTHAPA